MSLYSRKGKKDHFDLEKYFGAYSGMFANLCKVFLLLYVVVTLQNITISVSKQIESQKLASSCNTELQKVVEGYEKQLQAYQSEKDKYLAERAPKQETAVYKEAMNKLASLEEEQKAEIEDEIKTLKEAQTKLNEVTSYKALIKSIIDSKYVTQAKLANLEKVKEKVEAEKKDSQAKLAQFRATYEAELAKELQRTKKKLNQELVAEVSTKKKELQAEYQHFKKKLKTDYDSKVEQTTEKHQQELAEVEQSLDQTKKSLSTTNQALSSAKNQNKRYLASMNSLKDDVDDLRAIKTGREKLIGAIASELKGAFESGGMGGAATTDMESGEVVIFFPDTYFEYGSHKLKDQMRAVLKKALPIYANTVFGSKKYGRKIGWIEIVGFASPTYKGKYVAPESMSADARRALNYNMDLSYKRAKAIFEFIFDPSQMAFPFQKSMVLMTKVAGRSYLASKGKSGKRALAMDGPQKFCEKFNCAAEQRVAIRFHLKEGS